MNHPTPPPDKLRASPTDKPQGAELRPQTMDEWFLSLEKGRQAMLREDKWMLAQAAFIAGATAGSREQLTAANEALEKAKAERDEYYARAASMLYHIPPHVIAGEIQKWRDDFLADRNKLTVALEQSGKREAALREELAPLRELVGVDPRAASGLHDIAHWTLLHDRVDRAAALRDALNVLLVPYLDDIKRNRGGLPSGVYVQRFRFEHAQKALSQQAPTNDPTGSTPQG